MVATHLHMYGTGAGGTQDGLASIDIPEDGLLSGLQWAVNADLDADGESMAAEVSFIATNQMTINDSRGNISIVRVQLSVLTSGAPVVSLNQYVPLDLPVAGGERLYLHVSATAGVASGVSALLQFVPDRGVLRRSQRRR